MWPLCYPGGTTVHLVKWWWKEWTAPRLVRVPLGRILEWRVIIEQLKCNNLFVYHHLIPTIFLNKSGGVFCKTSLKSNYFLIMASQKMRTAPFNLHCQIAHFIYICEILCLTWVNRRILLPWVLKGEGNAGTEEGCAGTASSCCAGAVHSTGGFSGGSNELLKSGGFCGAATMCQHLPQCSSLGRLLSLGIMQDHDSLPGCPAPCSLCCAQPVIFLLVVYLLVWVTHSYKDSWYWLVLRPSLFLLQ